MMTAVTPLTIAGCEERAMTYVIQRSDGKFVSRSGSAHSYTGLLQYARSYPTRQAAERDLCPENERVVPVETILQGAL